jgi:hypothetical protein
MKNEVFDHVKNATEVVFAFDTTGSMAPCIAQVRSKIEELCEGLFADIEGLKVGLMAHGDYCDGDNVLNVLKLTDDQAEIYKFIKNVPNTSGGDAPECYELVLKEAQNMGWSDAPGKILVIIGDAEPHSVDYELNEQSLDWKVESEKLVAQGVKIYPLQCLFRPYSTNANAFWSGLSEISKTPLIKLDDFNEAAEAFKGFTYAAAGSEAFAKYEEKAKVMTLSASTMTRNATLRKEAEKR